MGQTGLKNTISETVKIFSRVIVTNQNAKIQKASDWFKRRYETVVMIENSHRKDIFSSICRNGLRYLFYKALSARNIHYVPKVS